MAKMYYWCDAERNGLRWVRIARTTMGRSPKDWWLAMKCDVPGIMPVSVCVPAKLYEPRHWTRYSAGGLSGSGRGFS